LRLERVLTMRILALALFCFSSIAQAVTVESYRSNVTATAISAKAGNVPAWTGWLAVSDKRAAIFNVSFTDTLATDSTFITMRCEYADTGSTTADAGFDIMGKSVLCSPPPGTGYCSATLLPAQWVTIPPATATTQRTGFIVTDIPGRFINCYFAITGGVAAESYTVTYSGVTP